MMRWRMRVVWLGMLGLAACAASESEDRGGSGETASTPSATRAPAPPGPATRRPPDGTAWVIFGVDTVVAEVARTEEERAEGLMYRDEVPDGTGMLFVFQDVEPRSFWMQNTYVALDIAYMGPDFTIVDIQQMEPRSTDQHPSAAPAQYALEVRQGWFAEKGIAVGARPEVVFGLQR